jgi:hypothetical protein
MIQSLDSVELLRKLDAAAAESAGRRSCSCKSTSPRSHEVRRAARRGPANLRGRQPRAAARGVARP